MVGSVESIFSSLVAPNRLHSAMLGLLCTLGGLAEHVLVCRAAGQLCGGSWAVLGQLLCLSPGSCSRTKRVGKPPGKRL